MYRRTSYLLLKMTCGSLILDFQDHFILTVKCDHHCLWKLLDRHAASPAKEIFLTHHVSRNVLCFQPESILMSSLKQADRIRERRHVFQLPACHQRLAGSELDDFVRLQRFSWLARSREWTVDNRLRSCEIEELAQRIRRA